MLYEKEKVFKTFFNEQTVNTTNYNAALQVQGPDDMLTREW
jgi:hypothetical protein